MLVLDIESICLKGKVLSLDHSYKLHTYPPKLERLGKSKLEVTPTQIELDVDSLQLYSHEGHTKGKTPADKRKLCLPCNKTAHHYDMVL